jgi:uncharacterized protein YjcR
MHGARGGAPKGNRNARKHGEYSAAALSDLKTVRALIKASRLTAQVVGD